MLGDNVRYDAKVKHYPELNQFIQQHFSIISVCPEVEIGLSVPRPPVQLVQSSASENHRFIKIIGRDDPSIDITQDMQKYCLQRPPQLNSIHGYIFKSKSPSCGVHNVPLLNTDGDVVDSTSGVFVDAILALYPELPISDELSLFNTQQLTEFLQRTRKYQQGSINR